MCNIAGYVGSRPAAPILLELIRAQEGLDGGHYTGIATMHEGKIYYAKIRGDLDRLTRNTEAANLPGSIGIIHSRTPGGGDDEWSHPFVRELEGTVTMAYVANGGYGHFADRLPDIEEKAVRLEEQGYIFRSKTDNAIGNYPQLGSGGCVHVSDVMAQLIASGIERGMDASKAMDGAFCEMPAEIVGLILALGEPESITWSRINMPMFVGFADHGAYLASAPQAFGEDAGEAVLLPACCGGRIYADRYTVKPYACPPAKVAPIGAGVLAKAYYTVEAALKAEKCTFNMLTRLVKPLFDKTDCTQTNALVYHVLNGLYREGRLEMTKDTVPGMIEGLTAPVCSYRLK